MGPHQQKGLKIAPLSPASGGVALYSSATPLVPRSHILPSLLKQVAAIRRQRYGALLIRQ